MMGSKVIKIGAVAVGTLLMSTSAWANCGGSTYCKSTAAGQTLTPLSNYHFTSSHRASSPAVLRGSSATASAYASASSYASSGRVMASSHAASTYGTGSISSAYASANSSSSTLSTGQLTSLRVPGLGAGERLCATSCPVNVHNPAGGKVLDCYKICKPVKPLVKRTIRHIRPVYYVRYAVPVPTCYRCTPKSATRYGISRY